VAVALVCGARHFVANISGVDTGAGARACSEVQSTTVQTDLAAAVAECAIIITVIVAGRAGG